MGGGESRYVHTCSHGLEPGEVLERPIPQRTLPVELLSAAEHQHHVGTAPGVGAWGRADSEWEGDSQRLSQPPQPLRAASGSAIHRRPSVAPAALPWWVRAVASWPY